MKSFAKLSDTYIPMTNGAEIPALGFGTLIPDLDDTVRATKAALEIGFRQFDCAERYRNEEAVGEAFQEVLRRGSVKREEIFIGTKLWNTCIAWGVQRGTAILTTSTKANYLRGL